MKTKKKEKKGLHSQLRPVDTGRCLFSGHISRLGGHVHSLAGHDEIFLCGFCFFPTNSGMKTKKSLRREILSFVLTFICVFRLGSRCYSSFGDTSSISGGTGPEMHSSGTGSVTFFWAQFSLGEAKAMIYWGERPRNVPPWRRACPFTYNLIPKHVKNFAFWG